MFLDISAYLIFNAANRCFVTLNGFMCMEFFMKLLLKLSLGLLLLSGLYRYTLPASYAPQQAGIEDLPVLLALYEKLDAPGKHGLLVYPATKLTAKLAEAIEQKRFFITYDHEHQPLAMLKMFILDDPEERRSILTDELCIKPGMELDGGTLYSYRKNAETLSVAAHIPVSILAGSADEATYLYVGCEYTVADYRGRGIQHGLIQYAFEQLLASRVHRDIALLYGQIEANHMHYGIVRALCCYLTEKDVALPLLHVHHMQYTATKPEFIIDEYGDPLLVFLPKNAGRGNVAYIALSTAEERA